MDQPELRRLALAEIDAVYRMAFHLTRQSDDAADLVQETFVRALGGASGFQLGERGIRPWLFKILHNAFYTRLGQQSREPTILEDLHDESIADELEVDPPCWDLSSLDWDQIDERLKRAIDSLPYSYREVLLLWAVEGLKYREIAEVLGVALGTVMSRLYRARMILSKQLGSLATEMGLATEET